MFSNLVTNLVDFIQTNGSWSIFLGGIVEEIIIPIPSPLVSISGGALLIKEKCLGAAFFSIFTKVSLPFALGATLGATLAYLIAFWGGKLLVERLEKYLGFSWQAVEKTREKYIKGSRDELAIILMRTIPVIPVSLISVVCGIVRLNWKEFYLYTFLGLLLRSFILGLIGWQVGRTYQSWVEGIDRIETVVLAIILLASLVILGFLYWKREKFLKAKERD